MLDLFFFSLHPGVGIPGDDMCIGGRFTAHFVHLHTASGRSGFPFSPGTQHTTLIPRSIVSRSFTLVRVSLQILPRSAFHVFDIYLVIIEDMYTDVDFG